MSEQLAKATSRVEREGNLGPAIEMGQWYWIKIDGEKKPRLGCVTHLGSNYVELSGIYDEYRSTWDQRVHLDEFASVCTPELNATAIIEREVLKRQEKVRSLMEQVRELTARLGVAPRGQLEGGATETQALATRNSEQSIENYKQSLIKAKDKELPALFEKIKKEHEALAQWMRLPLMPLKAETDALEDTKDLINNRIFNVELYAGLTEDVVQIKEGEPAAITERLRLFQRRAYMDEECLANYDAGGMEFKNLDEFDTWLVRPENISRILPFPRCAIAFRVCRGTKEREAVSLGDFIAIHGLQQLDKLTFLYIRNGEQVFRLKTELEFDEQLFPDVERSDLNGVIYAKQDWNKWQLISENQYLGLQEDYARLRKELAALIRDLRLRKVPRAEWPSKAHSPKYYAHENKFHGDYIRWTPDSVYYDDIAEAIQKQIDYHNRLVLILQGLLDRSPVIHPHPPLQLWTPEGFNSAIELIYDGTRGLVAGDKPDFEVYRAQLNKSIDIGSVTVGQQDYWLRHEAEKEMRRREQDWRLSSSERYRHIKKFSPYGNYGPGRLARVAQISKQHGAQYRWTRERQHSPRRYTRNWNNEIGCRINVPTSELLNASAYTPGDFKLFFNDPRTRAEYLQWAPLLLAAEDFSQGKRKVNK